ncbi:MAG: major tail protein [Roseburia sp.]
MPKFDLRGIRIGKYTNTAGNVTYSNPTSAGDAMTANLELKFAEGRLYAESKLAEYVKLATGGTISMGVKYIPEEAQKMMFGCKEKERNLNIESGSTAVKGLLYSTKDETNYVGVGFYAPDMIDGVQKYTCIFVYKAQFGMPSMSFQTKGETITFQTPTTTGEFLASDANSQELLEVAIVDSEAAATAWIKNCLGEK